LDEVRWFKPLESGALGGAALDVARRAVPAESPFGSAESDHHAAHERGERPALDRQAAILIELLEEGLTAGNV